VVNTKKRFLASLFYIFAVAIKPFNSLLMGIEYRNTKNILVFKLLRISLLIIGLALAVVVNGQPKKWKNKKYFTVVSYNVENLFDTINDPSINDNEFTPNSEKQYNSKVYYEKLTNLSSVMRSINLNEFPEIVGLVEVENRTVLLDLVNSPKLKEANYQVILEEGPDPRGIDCALLYRPDAFKYISHKAVEVRYPESNRRTRDILYVKGLVKKDTVHLFVNHWTSRREGAEKSEPKRMACANALKKNVDSVLHINNKANIILMGDFNDEPSNKSIFEGLDAGKKEDNKTLINLMSQLDEENKGSYYYKGSYETIDHLIVNPELTSKSKGFRLFETHAYIFSADFICFTQKNGDKTPSKSYGGNKYYGGYSDHFPIYTIFYEK
jgi:predicted extracellular nuclease